MKGLTMIYYKIEMHHNEKTFESLSRMQYDLFCASNRITRTILSILLIAGGIINLSEWWGILLAAYGCYLTTSTYSSANHTAHNVDPIASVLPIASHNRHGDRVLLCLLHSRTGANEGGSSPRTYGSGTNLGEGVVVDLSYSYSYVPAAHTHRAANRGASRVGIL